MMLSLVFGLASCTNEDPDQPINGDGVSFSIQLPKDMQTRATFGDETTVALNNLEWTVFEQVNGEWRFVESGKKENAFSDNKLNETVSLPLMNNKVYQIAFFANNTASGFVSYKAETGDIQVDYTGMSSNDAQQDAFVGKSTVFTVNGAVKEVVNMQRPFAQLNWGTDDLDAAVVQPYIQDLKAHVSVTSGLYSSLNIISGEVGNPVNDAVEFGDVAFNDLPDATFPVSDYTLIAMNYLLADGVVNVSLNFNENVSAINVNNAAVKPNYRTNIYGSLLTNPGDFDINVTPGFDGDVNSWNTTEEELAALISKGGVVVVNKAVGTIDLTDYAAGVPLTLVLNKPVENIYVKDFSDLVTVKVTKDVAYPKLLNKTKTGYQGYNSFLKNFTLEGDVTSSETCGQLLVYSFCSGTENVTIKNVRFDGEKFKSERNPSAILNDRYPNNNLVVTGCVFENMYAPAVYISNSLPGNGNPNQVASEKVTVENCTITEASGAASSSNGLYILQTNNVVVTGCTISNVKYHGIFVRALDTAVITGNTIIDAPKDGIKVECQLSGYTSTPKSVVITDNSVKAYENGIRVKSLDAFPAVCTVTGNTIDMSEAIAFSEADNEPWGILLVCTSPSTVESLLNISGNKKVGNYDYWFHYEGFTPAAGSNYSNPF